MTHRRRRLRHLAIGLAGLAGALLGAPSVASAAELGPVQHVAVDGMSMGYRTGGSGFPLIMVIGRGATMAEWAPQLVSELIGNHRVVVFDNRGVGTTDNPSTQTLSIQQMAEDTLALANALHIQRFDLMGWSMGGYISQQVTLEAPGRVARLVLCATDAGGSHYVEPLPAVQRILTNPGGVTTAQLLALSFPPTKAGVTGATRYMYEVAKQPDLVPESFAISSATAEQQQLATAAWKASGGGSYEELPTIGQRTLVAWGNLDLPVRPRNDRILARRIPRARTHVFRGAGHAFLFQDPVQVGEAIDSFLG